MSGSDAKSRRAKVVISMNAVSATVDLTVNLARLDTKSWLFKCLHVPATIDIRHPRGFRREEQRLAGRSTYSATKAALRSFARTSLGGVA
jgi:hypothetical protein